MKCFGSIDIDLTNLQILLEMKRLPEMQWHGSRNGIFVFLENQKAGNEAEMTRRMRLIRTHFVDQKKR